jgi:hypothetical protein
MLEWEKRWTVFLLDIPTLVITNVTCNNVISVPMLNFRESGPIHYFIV